MSTNAFEVVLDPELLLLLNYVGTSAFVSGDSFWRAGGSLQGSHWHQWMSMCEWANANMYYKFCVNARDLCFSKQEKHALLF